MILKFPLIFLMSFGSLITSYFAVNHYIFTSHNNGIFAQTPKVETTSETKIEVSIVEKEILELTKQEYELEKKEEKLVINEKNEKNNLLIINSNIEKLSKENIVVEEAVNSEKTNLGVVEVKIKENIEKAAKLNEEMTEIKKSYDNFKKSERENNQKIISLKATTESQKKNIKTNNNKELIIITIQQSQLKTILFQNLGLLNQKIKNAELLQKKINNSKSEKEQKDQEINVNISKKNELNKRKQEKQQQINTLEGQKKAIESQIVDYSSQQKNQEFVVNQLTSELEETKTKKTITKNQLKNANEKLKDLISKKIN